MDLELRERAVCVARYVCDRQGLGLEFGIGVGYASLGHCLGRRGVFQFLHLLHPFVEAQLHSGGGGVGAFIWVEGEWGLVLDTVCIVANEFRVYMGFEGVKLHGRG